MKIDRRASIQRSLRTLVETFAAQMELLERTYGLLSQELSLDPIEFFERSTTTLRLDRRQQFVVDQSRLTITFRGKSCFLGNTLPFRFLAMLAERPNTYIPHEDLLTDIWEGYRSDAAIRSVVKVLRRKLRKSGLAELADAIDGSTSGHYSLKLSA